jgi:signal transduction histidine kinase
VIFWALILSLLLTRRRDNERRLLALANAARAASNAKTEFLSTMTHEMRTPLNSVNGMSDVLLMTELDERQRRAVLSIQRAGFEILARVENMLEISSHDGKGVILQHHAFSIGDLVRGAIDALLPDLTAKGLALEVSVDPALANFYHTDTDRLTRVIKSLMDNAVKFTEEGTVAVKVERLRQSTDSDLIRFEVADTGIGIPEDQRDQIFSAFEQADSSLAREHGGAGLGLAVSRLIVEAMGSEIHFRSEVGQGTAFWFDLALEPLEPSHYRRQTSAGSGAI